MSIQKRVRTPKSAKKDTPHSASAFAGAEKARGGLTLRASFAKIALDKRHRAKENA